MDSTAGCQYSYTYSNLQGTIQKICLIISGSGHSMLIHEYLEMDVYGLPLVINSVCPYNKNIFCCIFCDIFSSLPEVVKFGGIDLDLILCLLHTYCHKDQTNAYTQHSQPQKQSNGCLNITFQIARDLHYTHSISHVNYLLCLLWVKRKFFFSKTEIELALDSSFGERIS